MGLFNKKRKEKNKKDNNELWDIGLSDAENEDERFIENMEMMDVIMDEEDWI